MTTRLDALVLLEKRREFDIPNAAALTVSHAASIGLGCFFRQREVSQFGELSQPTGMRIVVILAEGLLNGIHECILIAAFGQLAAQQVSSLFPLRGRHECFEGHIRKVSAQNSPHAYLAQFLTDQVTGRVARHELNASGSLLVSGHMDDIMGLVAEEAITR